MIETILCIKANEHAILQSSVSDILSGDVLCKILCLERRSTFTNEVGNSKLNKGFYIYFYFYH